MTKFYDDEHLHDVDWSHSRRDPFELLDEMEAERDAARADAEQGWALAARLYKVLGIFYAATWTFDTPERHVIEAGADYRAALAAREAR